MSEVSQWRRCNVCKSPIALGAQYWTCSVSTCNQKRTGLVFCSVTCWDVHLPGARHREAWAEEKVAPSRLEEAQKGTAERGRRRIVRTTPPGGAAPQADADVLVIASRLKAYVRAKSGFNTSDRALGPLSDIVRRACDQAIQNARREGRMTVLDRDVREDR